MKCLIPCTRLDLILLSLLCTLSKSAQSKIWNYAIHLGQLAKPHYAKMHLNIQIFSGSFRQTKHCSNFLPVLVTLPSSHNCQIIQRKGWTPKQRVIITYEYSFWEKINFLIMLSLQLKNVLLMQMWDSMRDHPYRLCACPSISHCFHSRVCRPRNKCKLWSDVKFEISGVCHNSMNG